jgi:hypothetical protein
MVSRSRACDPHLGVALHVLLLRNLSAARFRLLARRLTDCGPSQRHGKRHHRQKYLHACLALRWRMSFRKPVSTPDQVPRRLFPGHALARSGRCSGIVREIPYQRGTNVWIRIPADASPPEVAGTWSLVRATDGCGLGGRPHLLLGDDATAGTGLLALSFALGFSNARPCECDGERHHRD